MKMETVIPAPASGIVERVLVNAGDQVDGDDLLAVIGEGEAKDTSDAADDKKKGAGFFKLWSQ